MNHFFKKQSKRDSSSPSKRIINLIIVDESGSMISIYKQALDGMNETIKTIKSKANDVEGVRQYINLITFDSDRYTQHLRHCPAEKARTLSSNQYRPGGATPLYDAIGKAVTGLERHITENDAVLVTIITDGYENASHNFSGAEIKRLILRLSQNGWLFTYIGANQDVMFEAEKMGIRHSMAFDTTAEGTNMMWEKERASRGKFMARMNASFSNEPSRSMKEVMADENDDATNYFDK